MQVTLRAYTRALDNNDQQVCEGCQLIFFSPVQLCRLLPPTFKRILSRKKSKREEQGRNHLFLSLQVLVGDRFDSETRVSLRRGGSCERSSSRDKKKRQRLF